MFYPLKQCLGLKSRVLALRVGIYIMLYALFSIPFPSVAASLDADGAIEALRITSGSYAGGYQIAPAGLLQWYFANLGLVAHIKSNSSLTVKANVKAYLDAYIKNLVRPSYVIKDVEAPNGDWSQNTGYILHNADSDDAYAATFLSLVWAYVQATNDTDWAKSNLATLKGIAYNNLATQMKSKNSCVPVYQKQSLNSSTDNSTGYLQDNTENYKGLADFSSLLSRLGDSASNYYQSFANSASQCVHNTLWNSSVNAFLVSDISGLPGSTFYPDVVSQVFPQAYAVPDNASTTHYTAGYAYLNKNAPTWATGQCGTKPCDPNYFPWGILGYVAAVRGDCTNAKKQQDTIANLFTTKRSAVTINELGWYLRNVAICK